jgi:hypothetical protein
MARTPPQCGMTKSERSRVIMHVKQVHAGHEINATITIEYDHTLVEKKVRTICPQALTRTQ